LTEKIVLFILYYGKKGKRGGKELALVQAVPYTGVAERKKIVGG